ncbi:MAG: phage tail sheath subtilisin-like domain-containing protein [Chloroflexota bacterium]|nr:phage tail sheath subtilisin-like domain-containing protein [Chloroflexota bacterium]
MPEYLSPGVYVEEVDRGAKPIEGAGTAMPVFVGFSERATVKDEIDGEIIARNVQGKSQLVTNWSQYVETFGEFVAGAYMPHAVYGYFLNGGGRCYVISVKTLPPAQAALLNARGKPQLIVRAKQAGFTGLKLRVKLAAPELPAAGKGKEKGKDKAAPAEPTSGGLPPFTLTVEKEKLSGGWQVKEVREVTLKEKVEADGAKQVAVAYKDNKFPEFIELLLPATDMPLAKLYPRTQQQSLKIEDKALTPPTPSDFQGDVTERTGIEGLAELDDATMLVVPDLMTPMPGQKGLNLDTIKAVQTMMIAHCEQMGDRMAILDAPPNMKPAEINKWRMKIAGYDSSYAALYYPWIEVSDPVTDQPKLIPPSGYLAGIWARNDNTRGVHKAPANEIVRGATGLAYNVTKGEQDVLNPNGVNCIRAFSGRGIRVWGARTLSSDPSWRYINVRRLFNYVKKSIERGTQWVVFEPNEPRLWARVRNAVDSFLTIVWREGALFGLAPAQAFYVKCDEELNPPASRDMGRLIVEIGMSPVKPAEFVIFRISQWAGQ